MTAGSDEREGNEGNRRGEGNEGDNGQTVRVWLVERGYTNRDLITLVYATPDGERALQKERAAATMGRSEVTAARDVDSGRLSPVDDPETVDRYREEVARTMEGYGPDESI